MKELMLGNKALARGLYEAGCKVISSYPVHRVQRSQRKPLYTMRSIVSGHQMRRWLWKWHMARVWVESEAQRQ